MDTMADSFPHNNADQPDWCPVVRLIGAMVPVGTRLRVHSRFDRAVNLDGADGGFLISLVVRPIDMTATSVLVESIAEAPAVGASVIVANPRCAGTVPRWEGRPNGFRSPEAGAALATRLEELVVRHGRDGGMRSLVSGAEDPPVARFARAALERSGGPDWPRLIGLGIGLTPSGDDFLTGALLAECLSASTDGEDRTAIDRAGLMDRLGGTTAAGRTLLTAALAGRFPAYLLALVDAALTGEELTVNHLNHGHSSATDAVCGIIARLRMKPQPGPGRRE